MRWLLDHTVGRLLDWLFGGAQECRACSGTGVTKHSTTCPDCTGWGAAR